MKRTFDSEFAAGKESAKNTGVETPLAKENLRKMLIGIRSDLYLVRAYWAGYLEGILELCGVENEPKN